MQTLESLRGRIESTEDIRSVVSTMKAMAAVSINRFERAAAAVNDYLQIIETGFQIALRDSQRLMPQPQPDSAQSVGAVVLGSEQGMCGRFNEDIVDFALERLRAEGQTKDRHKLINCGARSGGLLKQRGWDPVVELRPPSSISGITERVMDILLEVEKWYGQETELKLVLFFNRKTAGSGYKPYQQLLLPLDRDWLAELQEREWPGRTLPTYFVDWAQLFSSLTRQFLYISLYRTFADSLAAENASRLAAMQAAEGNIEEQMEELTSQYNSLRQSAITAELLDVIAGAESITSEQDRSTETQ
jgi:F-type H+-transporting ATPase subunit gamma